eukprot:NODE_11974_length_1254_cov_4.047028.p1 GENE.NODE_11974_length_1254_cov_4.047028~~NODE_11974_length_1254_cov_4.047028.p1  ORF type:complete len:310 (-),score=62.34 NODE_11974_length_1254_cov_4.047028:324-1187(-)
MVAQVIGMPAATKNKSPSGAFGGKAGRVNQDPVQWQFAHQRQHAEGQQRVRGVDVAVAQVAAQSSSIPSVGTKVFVGQLPYSRSEADLRALFGPFGTVIEVVLFRHPRTQEKKGAAFVRFLMPQHARAAVRALDGFLFAGATRPILVSIATETVGRMGATSVPTIPAISPSVGVRVGGKRAWTKEECGDSDFLNHEPAAKLFVGMLPFSRDEESIKEVFEQYGPVVEVMLHRDRLGQKKGAAFVRFQSVADAQAALDLDGYMFTGATRAITVMQAGLDSSKKKPRLN